MPTGQLLTPAVWARRHRGIVWLLWPHVAGVAVFALVRGKTVGHAVAEVTPMRGETAICSGRRRKLLSRAIQSRSPSVRSTPTSSACDEPIGWERRRWCN